MAKTVKALVVAGGGGGGYSSSTSPGSIGGGGAGGFLYDTAVQISTGSYSITVGSGGALSTDNYVKGSNGGNSSFSTLLAYGGGGGGSRYSNQGQNGGSGGGSAFTSPGYPNGGLGTPGQGNDGASGGTYRGGGGGAGAAGSEKNGGAGTANSISGTSVTYAGGGAGLGTPGSGSTNPGGGGDAKNPSVGGSSGQNGIVIIRYTTADFCTCTGGTKTTDGSETIHTFTTSDTFSLVFASTEAVEDITYVSVTANGTTYSGGGATIVARGFVYNTSPSPTISNSKSTVSGTTGAFSASITGLTPDTTYYIRSYVTDEYGVTSYGEEVTFDTLAVPDNTFAKDISGIEGDTYAVRLYVGGTTGTLTVKIGSTGYSETFNAGAGYVTLEGEYSGVIGLMFESSETFDGYVDDVSWVRVVGSATIDWDLTTLTNVIPINSQVLFKRLEDQDFNKFRVYRYIDVKFKDLDAYVTVLLKKESNEEISENTKQFLVSNDSVTVLPFSNKKISLLTKDQAMRIGFSHNRLNETFTVCQLVIKGFDQSDRLFKGSKIINIT